MKPINSSRFSPFPGLRPFSQEEDYLFFGREEQTLELLQRLGGHRFVAVVGTSGSGKSSLVRCGLLSELLGGKMLGAGAAWEIAVTHPGGNPLALLTEALLDAGLYDRETENARENLLATLSRSHFGLVEAVKQSALFSSEGEGPGASLTNFLLVVDQFEEIFRFHEAGQTQQEMANEFVSLLLEAAGQKEVPIYVVLTMRSDFIGECGQFEGLAEAVNRGEFLIPRLNREQYKRVIEGPIKVAGGQIEPRLLQRLLNDLGQQADQLPCLQHALMRTWNVSAQKADSAALDLEDYQRVGRMSEALSLHADEIYDALATDRQRELCAGLFKALTVQEAENRGIRRPQRLGKLCQILDVAVHELRPIIDAYRQGGVTFLMPAQEVELTDRTIIDISHESLMRVWTRLRHWVEDEAQAAGIYVRLSESAALFREKKAGLYRDPELGIALAWQAAQRPNAAWAERYLPGFDAAIAFLAASRDASAADEAAREAARQRELAQAQQLAEAQRLRLEQQQRAASKLRKLVAGAAVVAVIAGLACIAALVARHDASRLAETARENEVQATLSADRAKEQERATAEALAVVESQKDKVAASLKQAEAAGIEAHEAAEAGRKLWYTTDMRLAPFVWRDDRATAEQLRVLLARHIPQEMRKDDHGRIKDESGASDRSVGPQPSAVLKPDLRGFEWHYYQHLLEHSAAVFSGHAATVAASAFTSDGGLVTLDQHGQLRYWDLDSQQEDEARRRDLPGGPGAQTRALSPDGRLAALAEGNQVHVFETSTGRETFQIDSANDPARRLVFSRDGDRLVIVDDKIRWCSAVNGELIAAIDQSFQYSVGMGSLALSADGRTLAVVGHGPIGSQFSTFRLDVAAKKVTPLAKDVNFGGASMSASALSADGERIAIGTKLEGALLVVDAHTGSVVAMHLTAHASAVAAMAFSGDGAKLATADAEGTIKVWQDPEKLNAKSTSLNTLKGRQGTILALGFSNDGKRLVSSSADRTAKVWDLANPDAAIRPLERSTSLSMARFSPDGLLIAAAGSRGINLWDASNGRLVKELPTADQSLIHSLAFSPADNRLLAVGYGGLPGGQAGVSHVVLWDIDSGTELARLAGATDVPGLSLAQDMGAVSALAFSPDGKYLAAGFGTRRLFALTGSPSPLKVWEVATRRLICQLTGHNGFCLSLDFSPDGTLLASSSRDGTAIIWSTETWTARHLLQNPDVNSLLGQSDRPGMFEDVAFSPDGTIVALASRERNVQLWEAATGKLVGSLKGHSSAVSAVAFAPDGRTLASGGVDQTVRLWNVETQSELLQLDPGSAAIGQVQTLTFSSDGRQLLAGGASSAAFWSAALPIWNDPDRAAKKLKSLLQSNAQFQSRIRLLSEDFGLRTALARLDAGDVRIQAALAASQANFYASRQDWSEAAAAYDRLLAADSRTPHDWLRATGLLRLATALLHQQRPADAAVLLAAGAKRTAQDPAMLRYPGFGFAFVTTGGPARIQNVFPGSPAARGNLLPGDEFVKVNGVDTTNATIADIQKLIPGGVGTRALLTVRRSGRSEPVDVEIVKANNLFDAEAATLFSQLLTELEKRLARAPRDAGLLELHAELAGHELDFARQVADYTAAINVLSESAAATAATDLQRLYRRRGDAHVNWQKWPAALQDYSRVVTHETTDEELLTNQALAQAEALPPPERWTLLKPVTLASQGGAKLTELSDHSILAGGTNPPADQLTVEFTVPENIEIRSIRLETLAHDSLPGRGPGRSTSVVIGVFALIGWELTAIGPETNASERRLNFSAAWADYSWNGAPLSLDGQWNITHGSGQDHLSVWNLPGPVTLAAGSRLRSVMRFNEAAGWTDQNLGRFRLAVSSDPAAFDYEPQRHAALKLADPWSRLAAAYHLRGDQPALDKLLERHPQTAVVIGDLYAAGHDWERAISAYSQLITDQTSEGDVLTKRAAAYGETRQWDLAAADWRRAAGQQPELARNAYAHFVLAERWREASLFGLMLIDQTPEDELMWLRIAPALVLAGDDAAYAAFCNRMANRFRDSAAPVVAERTVRACLLQANAIDIVKLPGDRLASFLDGGGEPAWLRPYAWATRALFAYRSGDYESAVKFVARSEEVKADDLNHALNLAVLAMAQHQLQHLNEARRALDEFAQFTVSLRADASNPGHHDHELVQILRREAQDLVDGGAARERREGQE